LLLVGIIFLLGYLGGLLANMAGLPKVSGYVLVGVLLSPTVTGIISEGFLKSSSVVVDFALAMVAYSLGGSLSMKNLRGHGKVIGFMTLGQGMGAYAFVALITMPYCMYLISDRLLDCLVLSLLFGAISLPTAPAATVATIHECRARGGFTSTLLAIVALDDAMGLMVFAFTTAFLGSLILGDGGNVLHIAHSALGLVLSTVLGVLVGLVMVWSMRFIQRKDTLIMISFAFFSMVFGTAQQFGLEPLFAAMVMGITVANIYPGDAPFMFIEKNYEAVVLAVFFVLAGAHIDVRLLVDYFPLAILFMIFRLMGKWSGSYLGGVLSGAPKKHSRYMGLALMPQAGIAIGLALYLESVPAFQQYAPVVINVIIAKTAINEVIGPYLLKLSLVKNREAGKSK
jgi:Kef-type K+ transport system membrane component KefB